MDKNKFVVSFEFEVNGDENLKCEIRDMLHNQYVGCKDYVDSNVVVHEDDMKTGLVVGICDCKKKQLMIDKAVLVINKFLHDSRIKGSCIKSKGDKSNGK